MSPAGSPSAELMAGNAAPQKHVPTGDRAGLQALTRFLTWRHTCKSIDLWLTSAEAPAAPVEDDSFREPAPRSTLGRRPSKGPALFLVALRKRAVKSSGPSATASGKAIAGSTCAGGRAAAAWLRCMSAAQQQFVNLCELPCHLASRHVHCGGYRESKHLGQRPGRAEVIQRSGTSTAEICAAASGSKALCVCCRLLDIISRSDCGLHAGQPAPTHHAAPLPALPAPA